MLVTKRQAIERVNFNVGWPLLNNQNTHFASINKRKAVWWLNIPLENTCKGLHLLLKRAKKKESGGLIWLKLPAGTLSKKKFRYWRDKDALDLEIGTQGVSYLQDTKSGGIGYDFSPHVEREFPA